MDVIHKRVWIVIIALMTAEQVLLLSDEEVDQAYDRALAMAKTQLAH